LVERIQEDTNFTEGLVVIGVDEPKNASSGSKKSSDIEEKYCYCQKGEQGRMICCENENCKISFPLS